MPEFNVIQQDSIERPFVSDNMGRINSQTFTFSETSFTKGYYDPMGGEYSTVTIKKIPSVLQLNYVVNPVEVGAQFEADDSYLLEMELNPKYAIHNAVLYEFEKDIDEIIADYDALGLKLIANVSGLLTFIDPDNLGDIQFEQGVGIPNEELEIDFTITSALSGKESKVATYSLIPWENVNLKTNYVLSGSGGTGDNQVTGFSITGTDTKTATITLADGSELIATFDDISSDETVVDDLNVRDNRVKIANVETTELFETLTALVQPTLNGTVIEFKFRNENGTIQTVNLDIDDAIPPQVTDVNVDRVEWDDTNENIINLIETDGTEHPINLTRYNISISTNPDGSVSILQGGEEFITLSELAVSGHWDDIEGKPSLVESISGNIVDNTDPINPTVNETLTEILQPELNGNILTLKYLGESGVEQSVTVDLSGIITTDINVEDLEYNASTNVITLNETDGTEHTIDLSEFSIIITTNPDGTVEIIQEGVTKITISKVGISGNYEDLEDKPDYDNYITNLKIPASELTVSDWENEQEVRGAIVSWINTNTKNKILGEGLHIEIEDDIVSASFPYTFPYTLN